MDHRLFIQQFQELQYGIVFDRYIGLGFATVCYSENDTSSYWNYAFCKSGLDSDQIKEVEDEFSLLSRVPTFYFEKENTFTPFISRLEEQGYKKGFEESWLFFEKEVALSENELSRVRKVENEEDLQIYIDTLDHCYVDNDPQNPYGAQSGYLVAAKNAWISQHTEKLEYFIIYDGDTPIAVSSLTSYEGLGYIANVWSLPSVRGKGFGKLATMYCVWKSQQNGNTTHFLITDEGTYPHEFYQRVGFKHKFYTQGFVKQLA